MINILINQPKQKINNKTLNKISDRINNNQKVENIYAYTIGENLVPKCIYAFSSNEAYHEIYLNDDKIKDIFYRKFTRYQRKNMDKVEIIKFVKTKINMANFLGRIF